MLTWLKRIFGLKDDFAFLDKHNWKITNGCKERWGRY